MSTMTTKIVMSNKKHFSTFNNHSTLKIQLTSLIDAHSFSLVQSESDLVYNAATSILTWVYIAETSFANKDDRYTIDALGVNVNVKLDCSE